MVDDVQKEIKGTRGLTFCLKIKQIHAKWLVTEERLKAREKKNNRQTRKRNILTSCPK